MDAETFLNRAAIGGRSRREALTPALFPSEGERENRRQRVSDGRFMGRGNRRERLSNAELLAGARLVAGTVLVFLAAYGAFNAVPLVRGWLGMLGIILFLHFGLFDLLALACRRAGINARPIMQAPLRARSLAEFWGSRWNTAFSDLARQFILRPLAKAWGPSPAMAIVFLVSGVLHEAVISLPAHGGYGLPMAYFALQAVGVLLERTRFGRAFGLGEGFRGRLFMAIFAGAPAFWLFHPVFVRNVILPMLDFIGAK
jgi:hypothetical protein